MKKVSIYALTLMLLVCTMLALSATIRASDSAVSVYIMDPTNPANDGKGLISGGFLDCGNPNNNNLTRRLPIKL